MSRWETFLSYDRETFSPKQHQGSNSHLLDEAAKRKAKSGWSVTPDIGAGSKYTTCPQATRALSATSLLGETRQSPLWTRVRRWGRARTKGGWYLCLLVPLGRGKYVPEALFVVDRNCCPGYRGSSVREGGGDVWIQGSRVASLTWKTNAPSPAVSNNIRTMSPTPPGVNDCKKKAPFSPTAQRPSGAKRHGSPTWDSNPQPHDLSIYSLSPSHVVRGVFEEFS